MVKLSICISTFNRAGFIGATLESIVSQLPCDCEVVLVDGASTDGTERIASECARHCNRLRYVRQDTNDGIDRGYDLAVQHAAGEYCWLMTDDDLMKPGAVETVLQALRCEFSLVIVNVEFRDFSMSSVLQRRWLNLDTDRVYGSGEMDRLLVELGDTIQYIGCIVIRRAVWLARARERYYGSLFVYVGVIFQDRLPGKTLVIVEPLISYRMGNVHTFSPQRSEISFVNWPMLVASLPLSETAKNKVRGATPWRDWRRLVLLRAFGLYSLIEYQRWIQPRLCPVSEKLMPALVAVLPGVLVNAWFVLYYLVCRRGGRLHAMKASRFYFRNWWVFKGE